MSLQHRRPVRNKTLAVSDHQKDKGAFWKTEVQQSLANCCGILRNSYFEQAALENRRGIPYRRGFHAGRDGFIDTKPPGHQRDGGPLQQHGGQHDKKHEVEESVRLAEHQQATGRSPK